jgi:hypothetical protein
MGNRAVARKKPVNARKRLPPITATELIRWEFVERSSRKGYLTSDFCINTVWYRWLSNAVTKDGLLRYGIREPICE